MIAFWPHTRDIRIASFRLRCVQIINGLSKHGAACQLYKRTKNPPDILVLSKRYDPHSINHAISLREQFGTKLILDLCDNHFYSKHDSEQARSRSENLRNAVNKVDYITASTNELAKIINQEINQDTKIKVIGDAVDPVFIPNLIQRTIHPLAELQYFKLKQWLQKSIPSEQCKLVWFGHHGGEYADGGMADLRLIKKALEKLSLTIPLSLTVISNSKITYAKVMSDWKISTHYLPWNNTSFSRALLLHDISVIPITANPFTTCKTNNRVLTSLLHNLGVIADSIPSYKDFSDIILLGDWENNIMSLCKEDEIKQAMIKKGLERIETEFSQQQIVKQWFNFFSSIS